MNTETETTKPIEAYNCCGTCTEHSNDVCTEHVHAEHVCTEYSLMSRLKTALLWVCGIVVPIFVVFGFRCPAQGCPACKYLGQ